MCEDHMQASGHGPAIKASAGSEPASKRAASLGQRAGPSISPEQSSLVPLDKEQIYSASNTGTRPPLRETFTTRSFENRARNATPFGVAANPVTT